LINTFFFPFLSLSLIMDFGEYISRENEPTPNELATLDEYQLANKYGEYYCETFHRFFTIFSFSHI